MSLAESAPDVLIWSADPQTTATFIANYKSLNSGVLPPMVTATDSTGPPSNGVSFTWTVNAITITNPGAQVGTLRTAVNLQIKASDSDGGAPPTRRSGFCRGWRSPCSSPVVSRSP